MLHQPPGGNGDPDLLRHVLTKNMVVAGPDTGTALAHGQLSPDSLKPDKYSKDLDSFSRTLEYREDRDSLETHSDDSNNDDDDVVKQHLATPATNFHSDIASFPFQVKVRQPTPPEFFHHRAHQSKRQSKTENISICTNSARDLETDSTGAISPFSADRLCSRDALQRKGSALLSAGFPDETVWTPKALNFPRKFPNSLSPLRSPLTPSSRSVRRSDIVFGEVIGKGGFGKVHAGSMHGQPVAIKVVQKRRGSGIHREIVQAERLAFTLKLKHENIVNIFGVNMCDGLRGDALIVMELVSPRTLQSTLDDVTRHVSQSERLRFALEITKALNYLHTNDVVHLDVKPRNVLMTSDDVCKLGDFGSLTRTRMDCPHEEVEFTQLLGTLPYRAPELMKGCFPKNKADIYSLGITLWQLVTRETPHSGANPHWLIYQVTKVHKRPDHHDAGGDAIELKYRDLYTTCWDTDPVSRPHAIDVVASLKGMIDNCWSKNWADGAENLRAA